MPPRIPEHLLVLVTAIVLALFLAPFVGIPRAARRMRSGRRSTAPVVLAACATGLAAGVVATGALSVYYGVIAAVLNLAWLWSAVQANRAAVRREARQRQPAA